MGKVILIAEDDHCNYMVAQLMLRNLEARIIWAHNGKEALDIVKNNGHIDVILMDIRMPLMDGIEATKEIRKISAHIPIIAVSTHAMQDMKEQCIDIGCNDYLSKPVKMDVLIVTVQKYLKAGEN